MDFDKWLNEKVPVDEFTDYKKKYSVPNASLDFSNFDAFLEEFEKLLIRKLEAELCKC